VRVRKADAAFRKWPSLVQENTVENHVPTAKTPGATRYAGNTANDDWPNNMHLE
jgi:hypothetical protein